MDLRFLSENRFMVQPPEESPVEEVFARDWEKMLARHAQPEFELLRDMCIELSFPVGEGQSKTPEFLAAAKRGQLPQNREGMWLPAKPDGVKVYLHPTPVGRLPVIECQSDEDFIRLHQSLACRCEPCHVPDSRGASIIKNYNNWARVNLHRAATGAFPTDPTLYRDYIALLSHRYYSGVKPEAFGLGAADWRQKSLVLRREHEAAHYMTQRYYHSAKSEIHDEIIADFMGLTAVFGEYDPHKFLTFMGLEDSTALREGGRLEVYLPEMEISGADFDVLCDTIRRAALHIAELPAKTDADRIRTFHALCRTSVANMALGRINFSA